MDQELVMAVDVGTGSARAGVFDMTGALIGRADRPILMHQPRPNHAEHSSDDIWKAVCGAAREARENAGADPRAIAGIAFDATCSLVALGADDRPVSVSTGGEDRWNTIVWLDHRAIAEAGECTASGHAVLDSIGGVMSPEMEVPKLMWLKRHLPDQWRRYHRMLDLADFLSWRATGENHRSACTLTCKWTYLSHEPQGWRHDFLNDRGLGDLMARTDLPDTASAIAAPCGRLSQQSAADLGLTTACTVGVGLIDAHAGALGVMGSALAGGAADLDRHIALIAGTSTCHMALSSEPRHVPGVWGPYLGAIVPDLWLNEGGQSASGALLDHVIHVHAKGRPLGSDAHERIVGRIDELIAEEGDGFAARLHVLPDFHGNRSPLADPNALGVISGLSLDSSFDSLARLYYKAAVAIALGTRHILDALGAKGYAIDHLHLAGGHAKNPLLLKLYADATGCSVVVPGQEDAVLLGTAMVAATAAGRLADLGTAAGAMAGSGRVVTPDLACAARFERDYRVFLAMHEQRSALDAIN